MLTMYGYKLSSYAGKLRKGGGGTVDIHPILAGTAEKTPYNQLISRLDAGFLQLFLYKRVAADLKNSLHQSLIFP